MSLYARRRSSQKSTPDRQPLYQDFKDFETLDTLNINYDDHNNEAPTRFIKYVEHRKF